MLEKQGDIVLKRPDERHVSRFSDTKGGSDDGHILIWVELEEGISRVGTRLHIAHLIPSNIFSESRNAGMADPPLPPYKHKKDCPKSK